MCSRGQQGAAEGAEGGTQGVQWDTRAPNGTQWDPMGNKGIQWGPVGNKGSQWSPIGNKGTQWGAATRGRQRGGREALCWCGQQGAVEGRKGGRQ